MRRVLLSAALVSAFALATTAVAQDSSSSRPNDSQKSSQASTSLRGTITSVDNTAKSFVVKDEATGKETTVFWDSTTKVNGEMKVGSMVSVQSSQASGRTTATSVDVQSAKKPY